MWDHMAPLSSPLLSSPPRIPLELATDPSKKGPPNSPASQGIFLRNRTKNHREKLAGVRGEMDTRPLFQNLNFPSLFGEAQEHASLHDATKFFPFLAGGVLRLHMPVFPELV